jgi:hypothetical protein
MPIRIEQNSIITAPAYATSSHPDSLETRTPMQLLEQRPKTQNREKYLDYLNKDQKHKTEKNT